VHLLILGCSSVVRRRVLPAARTVPAIERVSLASRRPRAADVDVNGDWFDDYDAAIESSGADAVYVSGVNAEHERWVLRSLDRGLHVVVDKPALLDLDSAECAVDRARHAQRVIAEATVFAFHPVSQTMRTLVAGDPMPGWRVTMTFCVPPLDAQDFRYRAGCGGGCLYDLGPYVAATNRLLFGAPPATVACQVLSVTGTPPVDTSFSVLLTHGDGGALAGHCGFVTAYRNHLSVLTDARFVEAERVFTTPPSMTCAIRVRTSQDERQVIAPAADSFALFLDAFTAAVASGRGEAFASALLEDARLLARLRKAARA
jgi:NDP-hexose-3-ketoreductase